MRKIIEFQNVSKKYPNGNEAIKDINFSINEGEFIVFIGTSGSGKTTALKMINRLEDATSGEIKIKGENIFEYNIYKMRWNMGYVLQQVALFPHLTVEENISIVPELKGWNKEEIKARTEELLEMIGLESEKYLKRMPSELSGGEAQRIGIARALAGNPEIILMDEPFSALDPITRKSLQKDIKELQQKINKTIVFVTHDIEEAFYLGDRIFIIKDGKILQSGTKSELINNPKDEFVREFISLEQNKNAENEIDKKIIENDLKNLIEFTRNGGYKLSNHDKMAGITFEAIDEGYKKMSYKINKTKKENKNKIIVNITIKYPDLSEAIGIFKKKILEERQRLLQSPNPTVRSEEEMIKLTTQFLKESVNEKLNDPNLRYFEETFDIVYVKHNDNWEMQESPQFSKAMFFNLQFNSLTQN